MIAIPMEVMRNGKMFEHRVWVGTLYSGESDFEQCVDAITRQVGCNVTHEVIQDLPEKEAHNALWDSWRLVKDRHDFFIKVDADTVIIHDDAFATIGTLFKCNDNVTGIQCPLYDFFSDSQINGMNCFSPDVVFHRTDDNLYCDRVDTNHKKILRGPDLPDNLNPVGTHCAHVESIHAFHYGLHRALKNQYQTLSRVRTAYAQHGDPMRAFALIGAMYAKDWKKNDGFNYVDESFKRAFQDACDRFSELLKAL